MAATKEQLQKEPVRFSYTGTYEVVDYDEDTLVSTLREVAHYADHFEYVLLDKAVTIGNYYRVGLEEQPATNPNDNDAVVQEGTVLNEVTNIDTLVYIS